jgi:hypothetical protein
MISSKDIRHDLVYFLPSDFILPVPEKRAYIFSCADNFSGSLNEVNFNGSINRVEHVNIFLGLLSQKMSLIELIKCVDFWLDFFDVVIVLIKVFVVNKTVG